MSEYISTIDPAVASIDDMTDPNPLESWRDMTRFEMDAADQGDEIGETEWFCDLCGGIVTSDQIDEYGRCPRCKRV